MQIAAKFNRNNIFLVDGIGALVTATLLSQMVARFEHFFGMPAGTVYVLAGVAVVFAIYSFGAHFLWKSRRTFFLRIIAVLNLIYCTLTLSLIMYHHNELTTFGFAYFIGEIIIVLTLVRLEAKLI